MNYNYSSERPQDVVTLAPKRVLNFDIEEVETQIEGSEPVKQYRYLTAEGNVFQWDRAHLISAIIRTKYSADDVEAIILNHGDGDEEHDRDYAELQQWRKHAKEIAKTVIKPESYE